MIGDERGTEETLTLFRLGDVFSSEMTITPDLMEQFSLISGDANPIHMDASYARAHGFDGRVAFGNLLGALISQLVGMRLPSRNVVIVRQNLDFRAPAYVGDKIRLEARVASIHASVQSVMLKLSLSTSERTVCTGQCLIKCL
jgi:acyl dehydratase